MKASQKNTLFAGIAVCALSQAVFATPITLTDGNSVAQFEPTSQAGQYSWTVDGQNQIAQQWFWYRIGNAAEQSIDTISTPVINQPTPGNYTAVYTNGQIEVTASYTLAGGSLGSGSSDLIEQIRIKNLGTAPLDFHFFEYVDFDLNGTTGGDTVQFTNPNTAFQQEGASILSETVDTLIGATSTHREVNFFANTLNALNDGVATTLNDNVGPIGPGDVTWAFQWDYTIAAGGSVNISKDKNLLVPEPTTLGLLALSTLGLLRRRRVA